VAKLLHTLLLLLARATEPEMVRMIEYLKAENRILRTQTERAAGGQGEQNRRPMNVSDTHYVAESRSASAGTPYR